MRAVVRGIAVCVAILASCGACSAGGPQAKQPCHCAQQDGCNCPLPGSPHASNKPATQPAGTPAARAEHRGAHLARHERRLERREGRIEHREARIERRQAHGAHGRRMEHREARLNRWEAWVERHEGRTAHREARMQRREARNWRTHERFGFERGFATLPYGYRSSSHRYAMHERFGGRRMHERFAMRGYGGYGGGYSEGDYGGQISGGANAEGAGPAYGPPTAAERDYGAPPESYADEGPAYGDEGPDYGPPDDGYGGGAGMSINAPAALDSWHGYGVECPPY